MTAMSFTAPILSVFQEEMSLVHKAVAELNIDFVWFFFNICCRAVINCELGWNCVVIYILFLVPVNVYWLPLLFMLTGGHSA
jgi:hypothetical protein